MNYLRHFATGIFFLAVSSAATAQEIVKDPLMKLTGHTGDVEAVVYAPNGKFIASGGWDNTIRIWNTGDGSLSHTFKAHDAAVRCLAYSRDGKFIISGSSDNSVKIWDSTWNAKYSLYGHQNTVKTVMVDPKMRFAYSGSEDGIVKMWDLVKRGESRNLQKFAKPVNTLAMSLTGTDIFVGTQGPDIYKLNVRGEIKATYKGHTDEINSLAFALNNKYLVSGSSDKTAIIWNVQTGKQEKVLAGHEWKVMAVAFSLDSRFVVTGSTDGTVKLWEVATGNLLYTFEGGYATVLSVAMSPDLTRIITSGKFEKTAAGESPYSIYMWDSHQETEAARLMRMKKHAQDSILKLKEIQKFKQDSIKRHNDSMKRVNDSVKQAKLDSLKRVKEAPKKDDGKPKKPEPAPGNNKAGTNNKNAAPRRDD